MRSPDLAGLELVDDEAPVYLRAGRRIGRSDAILGDDVQ
jgi:hypothetical protein